MSPITLPFASPLARLTSGLFGLWPQSLTLLVLRVTLATAVLEIGPDEMGRLVHAVLRRDGAVHRRIQAALVRRRISVPLSGMDGAGLRRSARCVLPVLLVLGLFTRYAAFGILVMTAIIQLTYPDGWQNFHLPWAAMAMAIFTFGGGKVALGWVARARPRAGR